MDFGYRPALDSVRALAVVVVVLFHAEVTGLDGGFLGVSVFFALSGFLITSLLIAEHRRSGRIDIGAFYARRLRRLAPAALVCIALVLAAGRWWSASQRSGLPADAVAALAHVANWRFALADHSYAELFTSAPSPLAHFWSLAVEEQAYLVIPVIVAFGMRRHILGRLVLGVAVVSLLAGVVTADHDLAYQATHVRIVELLTGALAAIVVARRPLSRRVAVTCSIVGLVALAVGVVVVRIDDPWLTTGGLAALSVVWAALAAGLAHEHGLARRLSWRPLVAVGRRSYGIYLFHWPLLLLVRPWPLAIAGAVVLASVSYRVLERPVRERRVVATDRVLWPTWAGALAVTMVAALVVVPEPVYSRDEQLLRLGGEESAVLMPLATVAASDEWDPDLSAWDTTPSVRRVRVIGSSHPEWFAAEGWVALSEHDPGRADAVVVAASLADRVDVSKMTVTEAATVLAATEDAWRRRIGSASSDGAPVVVFDPTLPGVEVGLVERVALAVGIEVVRTVPGVTSWLDRIGRLADAVDEPGRVLVLGDSTSVAMAQAISDVGAGHLEVVWAGANGCPVARAVEVRSAADQPWVALDCVPFDRTVPGLVAQYRPESVVVVVGPTELQEQRAVVGGPALVAGDADFARWHDDEFDALRAALGRGVRMVVVDCPQIRAGRWATGEMAASERVAAWNGWLSEWATSRGVVLWGVAAAVDAAEGSGRPVLVDGVHPAVAALTDIVRERFLADLLRNPT